MDNEHMDADASVQQDTDTQQVENPELVKVREEAENQKRRAEKAEQALKQARQEDKPIERTVPNFSQRDSIILAKSVDAEDLDEVMDYMALKKLDVSSALKDNTLQTILKVRAEERKTAQATTINAPGRQAQRNTAESMLEAAHQNQVPANDDEIAALAAARVESKVKAKK